MDTLDWILSLGVEVSLRSVVLLLLVNLVGGCAVANSESLDFQGVSLRQIPFPVERATAGFELLYKSGRETYSRSLGAMEQDTRLLLESYAGTMEYAIYRLGAEPPFTIQRVQPFVATASTGIWVGLANFHDQRWDFSGPYYGHEIAILPTVDFQHVSPLGAVYTAIVVANGDAVLIDGIEGEFFTL